jgi:magnesium transporter
MPRSDLAATIMEMNADDRADLYKKLSDAQREALMPALAQVEREDIRQLASYDEGTAGAIMTSEYASLSPQLGVTEALEVLRREAPNKETIYRAYVVDTAASSSARSGCRTSLPRPSASRSTTLWSATLMPFPSMTM